MQASCIPMGYWFLAFGLSVLFHPSNAQSEDSEQPTVTFPQGTLRGKTLKARNGRNISAFMGIPYAEPPIGDLRFANPVMAHGWNGTRDATRDANICPQSKDYFSETEDCLYLNVYTPKRSEDPSLPSVPVMVYIHGGALTSGSGGSTTYGPDFLLCEDVILVTFNYRLGALGFLSTGDEVAPGNWGLKDQVLALKWLQDNIEYFGGDPNRVTIFGVSAGGISVHLLALSNSTIGLFHGFITQSGAATTKSLHRSRAACKDSAFDFGKLVGCSSKTSESLINCLRTVDVSEIVTASSKYDTESTDGNLVWNPTDEPDIEGAFLTDSLDNLFENGQMQDLPWISGVDRDDGLARSGDFYNNPASFDVFIENINTTLPAILGYTDLSRTEVARVNAIKSFYFPDLSLNKSLLLKNLTTLLGDLTFVYPAYKSIRHGLSTAVNPRYLYIFNYRGTYSLSSFYTNTSINCGVAHGDEVIYLFPFQIVDSPTYSDSDWEMVDIMVKLWTSFATNGKPTLSPLNYNATWHPFSTMENYLQIGDGSKTTVEERHPFLKERMQFWTDLYAATGTPTI